MKLEEMTKEQLISEVLQLKQIRGNLVKERNELLEACKAIIECEGSETMAGDAKVALTLTWATKYASAKGLAKAALAHAQEKEK